MQGEKRQEYLDAIYNKSMRMSELITLLFEYVKMDSSGFELHRETCDLGEILRETAAALYTDFEDRSIELQVEIPDGPVSCSVDKVQMARPLPIFSPMPSGMAERAAGRWCGWRTERSR